MTNHSLRGEARPDGGPIFRFDQYTRHELGEAGRAFARSVCTPVLLRLADDLTWRELTLDWFARAARRSVLVDADAPRSLDDRLPRTMQPAPESRRDTRGRLVLPLTHSTLPAYGTGPGRSDEYWTRAIGSGPLELLLALECGGGTAHASHEGLASIVEAALRLAWTQSRTKVIVFSSDAAAADLGSHRDVVRSIERTRAATRDPAPWLWIDIPRGACSIDRVCAHGLLA